jgi:nucleotide-binding universal stress UspA family protein
MAFSFASGVHQVTLHAHHEPSGGTRFDMDQTLRRARRYSKVRFNLAEDMMYKHLLVPTDGSALSNRTIRDAAKLAAKLGAKITGFYVAPTYHIEVYADFVPPDMMTPEQHKAAAQKTAQRHLDVVRKAAADSRVTFASDYVLNDNPAEAIVKAAHKHKCDLIYMGSHGRSGISKLLLGSQTSKVLAQSRIPVLVHR